MFGGGDCFFQRLVCERGHGSGWLYRRRCGRRTYETGAIPTDNPFFNQATGDNRAIWARCAQPIYVLLSGGQYSCNWKVPGAMNKTHQLQARAFDQAGNSGTSTIQVTAR
jgi:hypothetical protein